MKREGGRMEIKTTMGKVVLGKGVAAVGVRVMEEEELEKELEEELEEELEAGIDKRKGKREPSRRLSLSSGVIGER